MIYIIHNVEIKDLKNSQSTQATIILVCALIIILLLGLYIYLFFFKWYNTFSTQHHHVPDTQKQKHSSTEMYHRFLTILL